MKVLLIADSEWVVNQTRAALNSSYEIVEIDDPRKAEDMVTTLCADLIIIDLQVGSMGGMALTRSLKSIAMSGESTNAPIVLLLDRSADEFLAKRSGADGWLIKPFSSQDLSKTLTSVLHPATDRS